MRLTVLLFVVACTGTSGDSAAQETGAADSGRADSGSLDDSAEGETGDTAEVSRTIPPGPWEAVAVGAVHACLLRGGHVTCFGDDLAGAARPPDLDDVLTLTAGVAHTCALREGGVVTCWGDDSFGQSTPPDATFLGVEAGHDFTCGVTTGGELRCWGNDLVGQSTPPEGADWVTVSAGGYHAMALDAWGKHTCWGNALLCIRDEGRVGVAIAAGFEHTVLLGTDGASVCGGPTGEGRCPTGVGIEALTAGGYHTCALAAERSEQGDGALACWPAGPADAPYFRDDARYLTISAGLNATCGITAAGEAECWQWTGPAWP